MKQQEKKQAKLWARWDELKAIQVSEKHKDAYCAQGWAEKELLAQAGTAKEIVRQLYKAANKETKADLVKLGKAIEFMHIYQEVYKMTISRARAEIEEAQELLRNSSEKTKECQSLNRSLQLQIKKASQEIEQLKKTVRAKENEIKYYAKNGG